MRCTNLRREVVCVAASSAVEPEVVRVRSGASRIGPPSPTSELFENSPISVDMKPEARREESGEGFISCLRLWN